MRSTFVATMDRGWRLFGTALSFAVFGLGALAGSFIVMPLIFLVVRGRQRRRVVARRCIGLLFRSFAGLMSALGLLRWQVSGLDAIDRSRSYLVLANHPSLIDVVFLLALFPQADCVVKEALWRNPLTGPTLRALGYISNRTPVETLYACIESLKSGRSLILFPEGTRTVPGRPLAFQSGAAAIAVRAGCDVLPVVISCDPVTLIKGEPWYRIPARRVDVRFSIEDPIATRDYVSRAPSLREATARFDKYLYDFYSEILHARAIAPETLGQFRPRG